MAAIPGGWGSGADDAAWPGLHACMQDTYRRIVRVDLQFPPSPPRSDGAMAFIRKVRHEAPSAWCTAQCACALMCALGVC